MYYSLNSNQIFFFKKEKERNKKAFQIHQRYAYSFDGREDSSKFDLLLDITWELSLMMILVPQLCLGTSKRIV